MSSYNIYSENRHDYRDGNFLSGDGNFLLGDGNFLSSETVADPIDFLGEESIFNVKNEESSSFDIIMEF